MKPISETEDALVLPTDFSNQAAWEEIYTTIREPVGDLHFLANMEFEEFANSIDEDGIFRSFPES
jgi:hypothetical protein